MCVMCVEIMKDKITVREVARALREFPIPEKHEEEFFKTVFEKFDKEEFFLEMWAVDGEPNVQD